MREKRTNPPPKSTSQPQPKRIRKPVGRFSGSPAPLPPSDSSSEDHSSDSSPPRVRKQQQPASNTVKKTVVSASTSRSKRPRQPTAPKQVKLTRPKASSANGGAVLPLSLLRLNGNLKFSLAAHRKRYKQLEFQHFVHSKIFNVDFLKELGIYETILEYMRNIGWENLLHCDYPTYIELTREFYATFEKDPKKEYTLDTPGMVSFRMLGTMYRMSYNELNVALGMYKADFSDAPDMNKLYGDFPHDFEWQRYDFWRELVAHKTDIYNSRTSRAATMVDFSLRVLHKWMAFSVSARPSNAHIVSKMEFFFLWCMKRNEKADFARWLVKEFEDIALSQDKTNTRGLGLGMYITRIAVFKGLIDVNNTDLHRAFESEYVDKAFLKKCHMLKERDGVLEFTPPEAVDAKKVTTSGAVDSRVPEVEEDLDQEAEKRLGNDWGSKLEDIVNSQTLIMEELAKIKRDQEKILTLLESYHPPAPSQHSSPPNST